MLLGVSDIPDIISSFCSVRALSLSSQTVHLIFVDFSIFPPLLIIVSYFNLQQSAHLFKIWALYYYLCVCDGKNVFSVNTTE